MSFRREISGSQRGSALLTVLWLTAALSAIGIAVASNVRGETERAATNTDDAKSYFLAQGAVQRAALRMTWGEDFFRYGSPAMDLSFPSGEVRVEIVPEASRLNINTATEEEIQRLLIALGMPEDRAYETTAAILDWRSPVLPDRSSPFDDFYLQRSPSFPARHASFMENEELLLVKGITPELYYGTSLDGTRSGLRDCISVHGSSSVDINTARRETFVAAGLPQEDAAAIVELRSRQPIRDLDELARIQQPLGPAGARIRLGGNTMYTLRATARLRRPDGTLSDLRRTVAALVKFFRPGNTEGKTPGVVVVRWYDRG